MRHTTWRLAILIALAVGVSTCINACGLFGGQTGQESTTAEPNRCDNADSGVLEPSPDDIAAALHGPFTAPFAWHNPQSVTQVTLELRYDGSGARRTYDDQCNIALEIPVTLAIATADGLLDEHVIATLGAGAPDSGALWATIPLSQLAGSYDGSNVETPNPDNAELRIQIELFNHATSGTLHLQSESTSGDSHDGSGVAVLIEVGRWPSEQ